MDARHWWRYSSWANCTLPTPAIPGQSYAAVASSIPCPSISRPRTRRTESDNSPPNSRHFSVIHAFNIWRTTTQLTLSILGDNFTSTEYIQQPRGDDLGKTIMYREAHMKGWAYKTLQQNDLKISVITGQGKRVMHRKAPT